MINKTWNLYNEDCAEGMKHLEDESVDLVVTSPPYDSLRTYNGFSFDFKAVALQLYRVLKSGGGSSMDSFGRHGRRFGNRNEFQAGALF